MLDKRVDLLGDPHRAQFRGNGAADPAGQHGRRQHGAKLPDERHVDHGAEPAFQTDLAELKVALNGEHHADEGPGQRDDRQAADPHLVKVRQQSFRARQTGQQPRQHSPGEQRQFAQSGDRIQQARIPSRRPSRRTPDSSGGAPEASLWLLTSIHLSRNAGDPLRNSGAGHLMASAGQALRHESTFPSTPFHSSPQS